MNQVKWWKIGFVRVLAITVLGIGMHGISYNFEHHTLWDFSRFSGPTSIVTLLFGIAIFVLGFRTEREHEKVSRLTNS